MRVLGTAIRAIAILVIVVWSSGCVQQRGALVAVSAPARTATSAPKRIVCLAPCLTETVFALGLGDRVVGVTDYCNYPPEARKRKRVGGLINPNYEAMFMLNPDLTILLPCEAEVRRRLVSHGIRCLTVPNDTLADVYEMIAQIGKATGTDVKAARMVAKIKSDLQLLKAAPEARRPTILLSTSRQPGALKSIYATGPGTFLHEILELVGGRNVMGDSKVKYPLVSMETLIVRNPDLILELQSNDRLPDSERATLMADWSRIPQLNAVKYHQVHVVAANYLMIPGPRVAQTARTLRNLIASNESRS